MVSARCFLISSYPFPQKETVALSIAKEAWDKKKTTTPFISKEDAAKSDTFAELPSVKAYIRDHSRQSWEHFWDGTETAAGGKHFLYQKFRDARIHFTQAVVRANCS